MTYTLSQKRSIINWRTHNKEKYNEYMNEYHKVFYQQNKEKIGKRHAKNYLYKKECKRLCQIFDAFL
jgi:hypothetical protein